MKAQFSEGKEIGQVFIHLSHARKSVKKIDKRSWRQRLQFITFCAPVIDKFWRM